MKLKSIIALICFLFLTSCVSSYGPRHEILGTNYGWDINTTGLKVLLDARVGDLNIRHVSMRQPVCSSGYLHHIEMTGSIGPDSTQAMKRLLERIPDCINQNGQVVGSLTIYMNSGGGLLEDGFEMGRLFRSVSNSRTVITGGQKCSSSCAIAFLGGNTRVMSYNSEILFHAPYMNLRGRSIDCSDKGQVGELKNYFAFVLNKKDGEFLHKRTMDYCSVSTGWILNADGARLFGLTSASY